MGSVSNAELGNPASFAMGSVPDDELRDMGSSPWLAMFSLEAMVPLFHADCDDPWDRWFKAERSHCGARV